MTETTKTEQKFDHWCLVELMGHQTVAGRVTEENVFGTALMRVDIPATANGRPGYTKWYGPSAIYAITPVEEEVARALANAYDVRPVDEWRLRSLLPEPKQAVATDGSAELREALKLIRQQAQEAQGEWLPVDASQAPEWTLPYKEIASDIDEALEREHPADEREREHLLSEEYGSDDDRMESDDDSRC